MNAERLRRGREQAGARHGQAGLAERVPQVDHTSSRPEHREGECREQIADPYLRPSQAHPEEQQDRIGEQRGVDGELGA